MRLHSSARHRSVQSGQSWTDRIGRGLPGQGESISQQRERPATKDIISFPTALGYFYCRKVAFILCSRDVVAAAGRARRARHTRAHLAYFFCGRKNETRTTKKRDGSGGRGEWVNGWFARSPFYSLSPQVGDVIRHPLIVDAPNFGCMLHNTIPPRP
jgi:hypothetical protein